MTNPEPSGGFTLTYDLTADDLRDIYAANPRLRRRRARLIRAVVIWAVLALLLTAAAISQVQLSGRLTPAYGLLLLLWLPLPGTANAVLRLSPNRLARAALRDHRHLRGRHSDEVGPDGVTTIAPDGTVTFGPWATVDRIHETGHAFHLFGADDLRVSLPKRGLDSPVLIPALRDFLHRSIGGQSAGVFRERDAP